MELLFILNVESYFVSLSTLIISGLKQKARFIIFCLIIGQMSFAQESYNACNTPLNICYGEVYNVNNIAANSTFCPNCEDDFTFCFEGENSIWLTFQTNTTGGDVEINFSNLIFEAGIGQGSALQAVVLSASSPCIASSYEIVSNCVFNETTNFSLTATGLDSNTTYYVVINGEMGASSNAEATFDVQLSGPGVELNPAILIGANTTTACVGENIIFYSEIIDCENPSTINWYANGVFVGSTVNEEFIINNLTQDAIITASVTCNGNCPENLTSFGLPISIVSFLVDAGPDTVIIGGETVQLNGQTDALTFEWNPTIFMSNSSVLNPIVNPENTTTYFLTGNNGICDITDYCTVTVITELDIPNTFTPNSDGANDSWEILGIENFPDALVRVYDRWGQLVFQSNGYNSSKRWDGTSKNGKQLAPSTYYYVIELRDEDFSEPIKGFVAIVR